MKTNYVCSNCGGIYSKWYGKCPDCANGTLEESEETPRKKGRKSGNRRIKGRSRVFALNDIPKSENPVSDGDERIRLCWAEGRKGSVNLLAGNRIGKSTLLTDMREFGENHKIYT